MQQPNICFLDIKLLSLHHHTNALMILTWTLFFTQLEDMKWAWEKITNIPSFYLVLQSTNIIIRPWSSQSIGNNFSVKALFHKFGMPLKFWHIWHRKLFYSIHIFTSIDCSILSCHEIWNIQLISFKTYSFKLEL